jgi:hypothetical protein
MIAPLIAVPVLAIVGVPQLMVASPEREIDLQPELGESAPLESRVGESVRSADDLFAPLAADEAAGVARLDERPAGGSRRSAARNDDAYAEDREPRARSGNRYRRRAPGDRWAPPAEALDGWSVQSLPQDRTRSEEFADARPSRRSESDRDSVGRTDSDAEAQFGAVHDDLPSGARRGAAAPSEQAFADETGSSGNPFDGTTDAPARPRKDAVARPISNRAESRRAPDAAAQPTSEEPSVRRNGPAAGLTELTLESGMRRLKDLGVRKHYFTYLEDQHSFVINCALPGESAGAPARFEAEADEPLLALVDVLQQIESWQSEANSSRGRKSARE